MSRRAIFDDSTAQALPLPGWRSPDYLALLVPGVDSSPQPVGLEIPGILPGLGTAGQFSVNGLRGRDNSFAVDGSDNNDEETGVRRQGIVTEFPQALETLREFKVVTTLADATYGRGVAGQIDALSKSGERSFHGQIWGFGTGGPLRAEDAFNGSSTAYPAQYRQQIPITASGFLPTTSDSAPSVLFDTAGSSTPLRFLVGSNGGGTQSNPTAQPNHFLRSQAGFQFGGPIYRKNTTFTISYERRTLRQAQQQHFSVPTVDQRQICPTPPTSAGIPTVAGTPPNSGSVCGSNSYPVSFRGDAIWSLYPFPNNPLGPYGANTFTEQLPADANGNLYMAQIDHHLDTGRVRHSITARYNRTDEGSILAETGDALFSSVKPVIWTQNAAIFFNSSISSTFANTFRMSYGATHSQFDAARDPYLSPSSRVPGDQFLLNAPLLINATPSSPTRSSAPVTYVEADSTNGQSLSNNLLLAGYNYLSPASNGLPRYTDQVDLGYAGQVLMGGFSSVGVNVNQIPEYRANTTLQFADTATKLLGKNSINFGVDVRTVRLNSVAAPDSRPVVDFHGLWDTSGTTPVALSAASLASIGVATTTQTFALYGSSAPNYSLDLRSTQVELFAQDDYPLLPNLRLTAGFRFQHAGLPQDASQHFEQAFSGQLLQTGIQECTAGAPPLAGGSNACQLLPVLNALMPKSLQSSLDPSPLAMDGRVGVAWSPGKDGKTSVRGGFGTYTGQFPGVLVDEARNDFPSFLTVSGGATTSSANAYYKIQGLGVSDNGVMVLNRITALDALSILANGPNGNSLSAQLVYPAAGLRNSYSIQQGLTVERQIAKAVTLSAAYVGTLGRRLLNETSPLGGPNRSSVSFPVLPLVDPPGQSCSGTGTLLKFPAPCGTSSFAPLTQVGGPSGWSVSSIQFGDGARSSYNSLQATVNVHPRGIQVVSGFTWSHSIDDASDVAPVAGAFALPQNSYNPSERASSNFDVRLRSVTQFIGDSSSFCGRKYCKNWLLSGIVTLQTAQPYTINTSLDVNGDGNATDRLNNTSNLSPSTTPRSRWLSVTPEQIARMLAGLGQSDSIGRNTFRGWGLYDLDLALSRKLILHENHTLLLRVEAFNVFNHPDLGVPVRILEAPSFGTAVNTVSPPRIVQVVIKYSF